MNILHKDLQNNRWLQLSLIDKMANIGSEILRAIQWKNKNIQYAHLANIRALELFDLTLSCTQKASELKEITRARELWLDFFIGDNQYNQTDILWQKYFMAFNLASRLRK